MRLRVLCILVILIAVLFADAALAGQVYSLARIDLRAATDISVVRSLHLDITYLADDYVDVVIYADRLQILDEAGLSYEIEIEDMTAFYSSRLVDKEDGVGSMGGYRTLSEIYLAMDSIANENPAIVKPRWSIGQSLEGRDIFVMKISDNPEVDEDEAEIYYNATIHAREVITPEVLIRFMRHVTNNYGTDPEVTDLVDNREMYFTLTQNPDGYYHNEVIAPEGGGMWRKTRRDNGDGTFGIDLNRNYGYMWGFDDAGSSPNGIDETYRGTGPFSEPESQVVRDFVLTRDFKVVVAFHSFTNVVLWPFGYNCSPSVENALFQAVGSLAASFSGYGFGTCCGINGYTGDWYYGEQTQKPKIYEFLVEVGGTSDGFWPRLDRITPLVEENVQSCMIFAKFAGDTTFLQPPAQPTLAPIGDVTSLPLELNWSQYDDTNPAIGYDIWKFGDFQRFTDDIEYDAGYWHRFGFTFSSAKSHSGVLSLWSGASASSDFTLTSVNTIHVESGDAITFWAWYDLFDNWNYGYVEVSTDGQNWTSIPGNITTEEDPTGENLGHGFTGSSGGWVQGIFDLSYFEGSEIAYRFRYRTGEFVEAGMYIDDISPVDLYTVEEMIAEIHPDTSFEISNIENGEWFFQVYAVDGEQQRSEPSLMELAVVNVEISWVKGDADGSGGVDIDDAVHLINYIFTGGPAPDPVEVGDADCSAGIDIDDVVYLIGYIFAGGPAPGDPNGDEIPDC